MFLPTLQRTVHQISRSKGWYETNRNPLEFHMLMVSEIAEASEEVRNRRPDVYYVEDGAVIGVKQGTSEEMEMKFKKFAGKPEMHKPEGEAVEMADALIRILDYAEYKGWNFTEIIKLKMRFNETRPHRHGGKAL